ncbi:unnamed protein product, partial [Auanema sp. JU1783]
ISYIRKSTLNFLGKNVIQKDQTAAKTANGSTFKFLGKTELTVSIADMDIDHTFLISEDEHCPAPALLGLDFRETLDLLNIPATLRPVQNILRIGARAIPLLTATQAKVQHKKQTINVVNTRKRTIHTQESTMLELTTEKEMSTEEYALLAPTDNNFLCFETAFRRSPRVGVYFINNTDQPLTIEKGETIGKAAVVTIPGLRTEGFGESNFHIPPEADWEDKLPVFPKEFRDGFQWQNNELSNRSILLFLGV